MKFKWDSAKNRINYKKHGVSFDVARKVFDDPLAAYLFDRIADGEERWHAVGHVADLPLLVVVHTFLGKDGEEIIRITSARQASSWEKKNYENQ